MNLKSRTQKLTKNEGERTNSHPYFKKLNVMTNTNRNSKIVKNLTMIRMIYDVARECNIPFDEVFEICYNYGFCDQCGNVSSELLKQNN